MHCHPKELLFAQPYVWMWIFFRSLSHKLPCSRVRLSCKSQDASALGTQRSKTAWILQWGQIADIVPVCFVAESPHTLSSTRWLGLGTSVEWKWMWLRFSSSWLHRKLKAFLAGLAGDSTVTGKGIAGALMLRCIRWGFPSSSCLYNAVYIVYVFCHRSHLVLLSN